MPRDDFELWRGVDNAGIDGTAAAEDGIGIVRGGGEGLGRGVAFLNLLASYLKQYLRYWLENPFIFLLPIVFYQYVISILP